MSETEETKSYCADFEPYNDTGGSGRCLRFNQRCFTWIAEYQPRKCYLGKVVLGHEIEEKEKNNANRKT